MKIREKDLVYLGDDIYRTVRTSVKLGRHTAVKLNSPTGIPFVVTRSEIKKVFRLVK